MIKTLLRIFQTKAFMLEIFTWINICSNPQCSCSLKIRENFRGIYHERCRVAASHRNNSRLRYRWLPPASLTPSFSPTPPSSFCCDCCCWPASDCPRHLQPAPDSFRPTSGVVTSEVSADTGKLSSFGQVPTIFSKQKHFTRILFFPREHKLAPVALTASRWLCEWQHRMGRSSISVHWTKTGVMGMVIKYDFFSSKFMNKNHGIMITHIHDLMNFDSSVSEKLFMFLWIFIHKSMIQVMYLWMREIHVFMIINS